MLQLAQSYTDVHGITHAAAVIVVQHASYNCNMNMNGHVTIGEGGQVQYAEPQHGQYSTLRYQAYLYPSIDALQAGRQPMQLRGPDNTADFVINNPQLGEAPTFADLVAACEQHILTEVVKHG